MEGSSNPNERALLTSRKLKGNGEEIQNAFTQEVM
jgi:hypothetical protein